MTGTSISSLTSLTTLAPTSATASATTSAAPLILASSSGSCRDFGRLDGCHWCGGGVGCPHVVGAVENVGVGGGRKVHVRYVVAHHGGQASSPDPEHYVGTVTTIKGCGTWAHVIEDLAS